MCRRARSPGLSPAQTSPNTLGRAESPAGLKPAGFGIAEPETDLVFCETSLSGRKTGAIRGSFRPGFSVLFQEGSDTCIIRPAKRPYPKQARFGPGLPIRRSRFPVPQETVSTPTENIVICDYFSKPGKKKATSTCKIAGLYGLPVSGWAGIPGGGKEWRYGLCDLPGRKRHCAREEYRKSKEIYCEAAR